MLHHMARNMTLCLMQVQLRTAPTGKLFQYWQDVCLPSKLFQVMVIYNTKSYVEPKLDGGPLWAESIIALTTQ